MNGNKLSLEVRGKFCYFKPDIFKYSLEFISITLALGSFCKVYASRIPCWNLNTLITETGSPFTDIFKSVKRR